MRGVSFLKRGIGCISSADGHSTSGFAVEFRNWRPLVAEFNARLNERGIQVIGLVYRKATCCLRNKAIPLWSLWWIICCFYRSRLPYALIPILGTLRQDIIRSLSALIMKRYFIMAISGKRFGYSCRFLGRKTRLRINILAFRCELSLFNHKTSSTFFHRFVK
jgi:hypothetical protein